MINQTMDPTDPAAAVSRIAELKADTDFTAQFTDKLNPGHKAALDRMTNLHRIAAAGEAQSGDPESRPGQTPPPVQPPTPPAAPDMTADQAASRITELKADKDFTAQILDKRQSGHKAAVAELANLHRIKAGDDTAPSQDMANDVYEAATLMLRPTAADTMETVKTRRVAVMSWMEPLKLTKSEARIFVEAFNKLPEPGAPVDPDAQAAELAAVTQTLKSAWGDEFAERLEAARRAVDHVDTDGTLKQLLETTEIGNDPWVIWALLSTADRNGW